MKLVLWERDDYAGGRMGPWRRLADICAGDLEAAWAAVEERLPSTGGCERVLLPPGLTPERQRR